MYHSVSHHADQRYRSFNISPDQFVEQMQYVAAQGYTPITVTQFAGALTGSGLALPHRPVVLTFDDGFADFYDNALPVLREYGFTATLYIPTAYVGGTSRWLKREGEAARPMLSWDQITEIQAYGIECGAHSHTHLELDVLPESAAHDEIVHSKNILDQHLARPVSSFAYPYGYYTTRMRQMVRVAGYTSACAVRYRTSSTADDPYTLARLMVTPQTGLDGFAQMLSGRFSPVTSALLHVRYRIWQVVRRSRSRRAAVQGIAVV
jgi:peptidoglycan/xylan/chitin deacetylase (PgdA/CDA1 family)